MLKYSYYCPVEIVYGKDAVKNFKGYSAFGKKCAVITGRNMYKTSPVIDDLTAALEKNAVEALVLAEAGNNPTVENVYDLAEKVKSFGAEFIIGVGGGSSMDAAKATALIAANPQVDPKEIFVYSDWKKPLPSIMIGTTAGTGSEVMPSAVLTVSKDVTEKRSLKTHDSYAKIALCDPQYTASMPDSVTVGTALDAICHSIEAIFSKKGGNFASLFGLEAIKQVSSSLDAFVAGKRDFELRDSLYYGSILAGLAINDGGTSFPHSMGYMLTTMHGIPHGYACAVFIAEFLERVSKISDISAVLSALGVKNTAEFKEKVGEMIKAYINIPKLSDEEIAKYSATAMTMSVNNNYLNLTESDCREIYCHSVNNL